MKRYEQNAEIITLRSICDGIDVDRSKILGRATQDYFGYSVTNEIFRRIITLISNQKPVPTFEVLATDPVLSDEAHALLENDKHALVTGESVQAVLDTLDKYRRARAIDDGIKAAVDALDPDKLDISESKLEEALLKSRQVGQSPILHGGKEGGRANQVAQRILKSTTIDKIKTGFKEFDEKTGGFNRGNLVILSSNFGGGKSSLALQLMINMYSMFHYKICMVSLEMSEDEVMTRLVANTCDVDATDIDLRRLGITQRPKIIEKFNQFDQIGFKHNCYYSIYCPADDLNIHQLLSQLNPFNYDVIIIDYTKLLAPTEPGQEERKILGEAARVGKRFAEGHKNVVIQLAQLSEEGRIKYSREVGEHCNNWWFWYCYDEDKARGYVTIEQGKARNAPTYPFTLAYNPFRQQWKNFDGELPTEETQPKTERKKTNVTMSALRSDDNDV